MDLYLANFSLKICRNSNVELTVVSISKIIFFSQRKARNEDEGKQRLTSEMYKKGRGCHLGQPLQLWAVVVFLLEGQTLRM